MKDTKFFSRLLHPLIAPLRVHFINMIWSSKNTPANNRNIKGVRRYMTPETHQKPISNRSHSEFPLEHVQ